MKIFAPPLALALLGAVPAVLLAPAVTMAQTSLSLQAAFEDDLAGNFAQLRVGMSVAEVMAVMKREPQRKEVSNHLGLEIQRLVWTQWTGGNTFQVVMVAGRLVSTAAESKSLFG